MKAPPSDDDVRLIRASLALGYPLKTVAAAVGLTVFAVKRVRDGAPVYVRRERRPKPPPGPRKKPGPKPKPKPPRPPRRRRAADLGPELRVPSESAARLSRAAKHWAKNPDMVASEVAGMYDISLDALLRAARRHS